MARLSTDARFSVRLTMRGAQRSASPLGLSPLHTTRGAILSDLQGSSQRRSPG